MKIKIITVLLLAMVFISCKKEGNINEENQATNQPIGNDYFVVTIDLVAQKDDSFHVFFSEDGSDNFIEENSVWAEFKGSPNSQKLVFNLPKERMPNQIRLDFGVNKEQGDVKINNIEISNKGKIFNISGSEFTKYFRANEASTIIDVTTQTIKPIKPGVNTSIFPLETLRPELEKLF
jgi:hypothetical protein